MTPRDEQHLSLLTLFYYLYAGLMLLVGLLAVAMEIGIGVGILQGAFPAGSARGPTPPKELGWFFAALGIVTMVACFTWTFLNFVAGYCLKRRSGRVFCIVVAVLDCLNMPMGTVLGACTLMVLSRPAVKAAFEAEPS